MTSGFYVALSHFNYLLKTVHLGIIGAESAPPHYYSVGDECREYRLYAVYGRWIRVYLHIRIIARRQHNPMRCDIRFSTPRKPRIVFLIGRDSEGAERING